MTLPPDSSTDFVHRFVPAPIEHLSSRTLLLLHGTGGNESDLLALGRTLDPGAALLSPRGTVLENGMPRFFRRLAEGIFDEDDLVRRTDELVRFIADAARRYGFDDQQLVGVGYSNGANIAASLLLLHPGVLRDAVLFRPMVPLVPPAPPDLKSTRILICAGNQDPIVPRANTERLVQLFDKAGATVTTVFTDVGHALTHPEIETAREWLQNGRIGRGVE